VENTQGIETPYLNPGASLAADLLIVKKTEDVSWTFSKQPKFLDIVTYKFEQTITVDLLIVTKQ